MAERIVIQGRGVIEDDSPSMECECGSFLFRVNLRDSFAVVSCASCNNEIAEIQKEE